MNLRLTPVMIALILGNFAASAHADDYTVDPVHSAAVFRVSHLGLSSIYGRFKDVSGTFTVDPQNPAGTQFELITKVDSIDTNNAQRDQHLKSPDFFNAKQFPTINFKSSSVKSVEGGFEITGTLNLYGTSKPLTIQLTGGRTAQFPPGVQRTGYSGEFTIKRSDFGMNKMLEVVGDDVRVQLSFEGTKK